MAIARPGNSMMFALAIFLMASISLATKSYPVTTLLNAKYNVTPVCLEIAEYLFDENPSLYWDYVENLNQLKTPLYEIGKLAFSSIGRATCIISINRLIRLQIAIRRATNRRFKRPRACWVRCRYRYWNCPCRCTRCRRASRHIFKSRRK